MKILHVLNTNQFSGAENVVCQIIEMFKGDETIEMAYCSPDGPIKERLSNMGITFIPLKKLSKTELKRAIREYKPDCIHAHDMRAGFITAISAGNIPFMSHIHNNAFNSRGVSIKALAYYIAARKAKHIFWVSKSSYEGYKFHNRFKEKSTILYNVIDIDALKEKMLTDENEYSYDVIYLCRLTYPKNPQRFLNIISQIVKTMPTLKVGIVGTGELDAEIKALAKNLQIENNVDFLGFQNNPLKMLHDSKVMVMTSRWEGTPMCALEAMALGVPIVSTPTDGLNQLIKEGVNGFLSEDDAVLVQRICKLLEDASLRDKMSFEQQRLAKEINDKNQYKAILKEKYTL